MNQQFSFTKLERDLITAYRHEMDKAESAEHARNLFAQHAGELIKQAVAERVELTAMPVQLDPDKAPYYRLAPELTAAAEFDDLWHHSDLKQILGRFAEAALHRFMHLAKHPEKSRSKMYHGRDGLTSR